MAALYIASRTSPVIVGCNTSNCPTAIHSSQPEMAQILVKPTGGQSVSRSHPSTHFLLLCITLLLHTLHSSFSSSPSPTASSLSPFLIVNAAAVDDYTRPIRLYILSVGLDSSHFPEDTLPPPDYDAEFQDDLVGVLNWIGVHTVQGNVPEMNISRTTNDVLNQTEWRAALVYNASNPSFHPNDAYGKLAEQCDRDKVTLQCNQGTASGFRYQPYTWMTTTTSLFLICCDDSLALNLQSCPVCGEKNYLPLILGLCLGFVGLIAVGVAITLRRKRNQRKKGKMKKGAISDAGHKPPPVNIVPAFDPQHLPPTSNGTHHSHHPSPISAVSHRPDHIQQLAGRGPSTSPHSPTSDSGPVVVTVVKSAADGKKGRRPVKDEPDTISSPIIADDKQKSPRQTRR